MVFLLSQRRVADPILDLRIFSNRNLSAASGVNLLVGFCIMVALVSVPVFINVAGAADTNKAALVTGYLLCAFTMPMAIAAIPGGWLSERFGYRSTVMFGLVVAIVGFWMMSSGRRRWPGRRSRSSTVGNGPEWADARGTGFMAAGLALAGIGIGLTIAPVGTAVINAVREQERGMASSLVIILRLIGMSISMSSMTAYGLRRTTILSREMLNPDDALDFEKTARVALDVVTRITGEIALISIAVAAAALASRSCFEEEKSASAEGRTVNSARPTRCERFNGCSRLDALGGPLHLPMPSISALPLTIESPSSSPVITTVIAPCGVCATIVIFSALPSTVPVTGTSPI